MYVAAWAKRGADGVRKKFRVNVNTTTPILDMRDCSPSVVLAVAPAVTMEEASPMTSPGRYEVRQSKAPCVQQLRGGGGGGVEVEV